MRFIICWLLGGLISILIPIIGYIFHRNTCYGAECAQGEFIFFLFPVLLVHTTLTMVLYYVLKKYKKPVRRRFVPAFFVSLPLNIFFIGVDIYNQKLGALFTIALLFGVCYFQSFICDYYDRRQKVASHS